MRSTFAIAAVVLAGGLAGPSAEASQALATQADCMVCHALDKKLIGPSFRDVAAKYKGRADAPALLAAQVRKGSKGVWGPMPMPATAPARVGDADLKTLISWVLKQHP